jgi:hypothetical protein
LGDLLQAARLAGGSFARFRSVGAGKQERGKTHGKT